MSLAVAATGPSSQSQWSEELRRALVSRWIWERLQQTCTKMADGCDGPC